MHTTRRTESESEIKRDRRRLQKLGDLAERARAEVALSVDNLPHSWRVAILSDALRSAMNEWKERERRTTHG